MWTGVSLAAANLYFAFFVVLTIIVWDRVIIPREEAELVVRFGEGYRAYMRGTGSGYLGISKGACKPLGPDTTASA